MSANMNDELTRGRRGLRIGAWPTSPMKERAAISVASLMVNTPLVWALFSTKLNCASPVV